MFGRAGGFSMLIKSSTRIIKRVVKVCLVSIWVGLALLVILEALALFLLPKPPVDRAPLVKATRHPTLGYALLPHQETYTYGKRVHTNSDGLRERELDHEELGKSYVILCLGGTETFGKGVAFDETYAKVLEREIQATGKPAGPSVVINAGVPDYNMAQSMRFLRERGMDFHPDVVLLSFYWDDLIPDIGTDGTESLGSREKPAQNEVRREWFFRRWARRMDLLDLLAPLYTRSRVLHVVKNGLKSVVGRWRGDAAFIWRDAILRGHSLPALEKAWSRVRAAMEELRTLADERGFRPLLLVLPIEHQLEEDGPDARFQEFATEMAESASIGVVDPLPALRLRYDGFTSLFIPYDGRPNAEAHAIIAHALFADLVRNATSANEAK